jgi:hypothetical protein
VTGMYGAIRYRCDHGGVERGPIVVAADKRPRAFRLLGLGHAPESRRAEGHSLDVSLQCDVVG